MKSRIILAVIFLTLAFSFVMGIDVPTPESVIGFRPGSDRQLADWQQIIDYFHQLDAASDRVMVKEVGKSSRGNPFIVVTISSPANLADLDRIRRDNLRLADARKLGKGEAEALIANGKTIVALLAGVHSLEFAGPLALLETAHNLASSPDPAVAAILDQTVILMVPSVNPDGLQRAVAWYLGSLGKPWENGPTPFLQHPYAGEELNHDWFMFTQAETRLVVEKVYDEWRPQITQDLHQMNPGNGCIFLPPYQDPWDPSIDPAIVSAVSAIGSHMAAALIGEGKKGVVINGVYNPWQLGRYYPHAHGGVRVLTEAALAIYASPYEGITLDQMSTFPGMGYDPKRASWNYPAPWSGGTWRFGDAVEYLVSSTRALLDHAVKNRTYWLRTFHDVLARASNRTQPYAFIVPVGGTTEGTEEGRDPYATARLLEVLQRGGVEVHRAKAPFAAAGRRFAAGSHVILMAQPFSTHAKILLERQDFPWRGDPSGESPGPIGETANTLPLLMGVEVVSVPDPFPAELQLAAGPFIVPGRIEGNGSWYVMSHGIGEMKALGRLLKAGVLVRWAKESFVEGGSTFDAGSLIVSAASRSQLEAACRDLGIAARGIAKAPSAFALRKPRVALYQSWTTSIDEGWTRFVFEKEMEVDYATVHDRDLRAGKLSSRFDVLILPDENANSMFQGLRQKSLIPDEYKGGIGEQGVASLREFVARGGTLIAVNEAAALPIERFPLAVANGLKKPASAEPAKEEPFYCPGSILGAKVASRNLLAQGLGPTVSLWFGSRSPAFAVREGAAIVSFDENPLQSGWLAGGKRLKNLAALAEVPYQKGRVILFGFRPLFKAESWGTYLLMLNAIYSSVI